MNRYGGNNRGKHCQYEKIKEIVIIQNGKENMSK